MIRERILLTGETGTGKTSSVLTIAKHMPNSVFHVIDTDDSYERMLAGKRFNTLKNVKLYPAQSWSACEKALADVRALGHRLNQWLVVDFLCSTWDFVQGHFVQEVFGKKIDDYFLEVRKAMHATKPGASKIEALKGWIDWVPINKMYQDWINEICYQLPVHVIATTKAERLQAADESELKELWAPYGVKPAGEKRNSYRFHTLLLTQKDLNGWYITTVKDREREYIDHMVVADFYIQYLYAVAGFSIEGI